MARTTSRSAPHVPLAGALLLVLVLLPWLAAVAGSVLTEGHLVLATASAALAVACIAAWPRLTLVRGTSALVVLLSGGAALIATASALLSPTPRTALAGTLGSARGAAAWLVAWAVLALVSSMRPDKPTLALILRALAVTGAIASALAVAQALGVVQPLPGWSDEPAAFMVGSNALGQLLVVSLGCALAWLSSASGRGRWAAAVCVLAVTAGAAASQSRGAWMAAAAVAALAALVRFGSPVWRPRAVVAGATLAALTLLTPVAVPLLPLPAQTWDGLNAALNDRPAIWRSASLQLGQAPAFGEGPARFSSYYAWTPDPAAIGGADTIGTFSPHSASFDVLLSTGVVGALLLGAALVAFTRHAARSAAADPGRAYVAIGLAGWLVVAAIAPVDWLSLVWAAALIGTAVAADDGGAPAAPRTRAALALAPTVAALVALLAVTPGLAEALRWREFPTEVDDVTFAALVRSYERTRDPVFAASALSGALRYTGTPGYPPVIADDTRALAAEAVVDAAWNADIARLSAVAWALAEPAPEADRLAEFERALDAGRRADPVTTVWDHLAERGLR